MWRAIWSVLLRTGVFLILLVVGARSLFVPSRSIEMGLDTFLRYGWSVAWIVGPMLCAWGLLRLDDRWQLAGYPLVIAGGLIYAVVLIDRGSAQLYIGLVVLAFVWQQASRFVQLGQVRWGEPRDRGAGRPDRGSRGAGHGLHGSAGGRGEGPRRPAPG